MTDPLEQARLHFTNGLAAFERGEMEQAEACFAQAWQFAPDRPSVLTNLGVTRVRLGRCRDALPLLQRATTLEPDNLEAWAHLGTAQAETGDLPAAVQAFDRALALRPGLAPVWVQRGSALRELGRHPEAAASFERAIDLGADDDLVRYYLASVRGQGSPAAPPRAYVETLFDGYADGFEPHLQRLGYQAPEQLVQALTQHAPPPWSHVLDLGCGTGLVGRLVRPHAQRVTGIDLSTGMLAQARERGGYDALLHADLIAWVTARAEAAVPPADVAVAADVFIYVGAIDAVLRELPRHLQPGGWLAFSLEALEDAQGDFQVLPSLRYAHSEAYVRRLAHTHGWRVAALWRAPVRDDQRQPVPGIYVLLQAPGTP